jgi:hypothetical protein
MPALSWRRLSIAGPTLSALVCVDVAVEVTDEHVIVRLERPRPRYAFDAAEGVREPAAAVAEQFGWRCCQIPSRP